MTKVLLDICLVFLALAPSIYLKQCVSPVKGGFYCSDQSLYRTYNGETYRFWSMIIIGLAVPLALIVLIETLHKRSCYRIIISYIFGLHAAISLVSILKFSYGRPRPIFMEWCQPVLPDGTTCTASKNQDIFIEDVTCRNENGRLGAKSRVSFPSGHASISSYASTYIALYLQFRLSSESSILLKHFLQFVCISMELSVCVSRVTEHMHFVSDVLVGVAIGTLLALWVVCYISHLKIKCRQNLESWNKIAFWNETSFMTSGLKCWKETFRLWKYSNLVTFLLLKGFLIHMLNLMMTDVYIATDVPYLASVDPKLATADK